MDSDKLSLILFSICPLPYMLLGWICLKFNTNACYILLFAIFHMAFNIWLQYKLDNK